MPTFLTAEEYATPEGQKAAWRSLMIDDHGWVRKLYDNSHQLSHQMWRTYQPSPKNLRDWAARGIKTVINLRGLRNAVPQPGFYWLEKDHVAANGMTLVDFRAWSREAPRPEFIIGLNDIFHEITYPAIMHCKSGADRAGIASALYLFLKERRPLDEALQQLTYRYGHVKSGKTGVLDHFFDTYLAAAAAEETSPSPEHFLNWVKTDYDKDAVQNSFKPGTIGNLLTEVILRRE